MNILEVLRSIRSAPPTIEPNYINLPCTQCTIERFNEIYMYWKKEEDRGNISYGIPRTKSGGISNKNIVIPSYEVIPGKFGCEMVVLSFLDDLTPQFYRCQYRGVTNKKGESETITGHRAFTLLKRELLRDGIDIQDYYIENGPEIKATIEKPIIRLQSEAFKDIEFDSCNHIDMRSSYPYGMTVLYPEFSPTIERLFYSRHINPINKQIMNMAIGYFQSETHFRTNHLIAPLAHISKFAIEHNNRRLNSMANYLEDSGRMVISYNTDGIWFCGEPIGAKSEALGAWNEDHINCRLRLRSAGCYEYIENGKYYPVVRGKTNLDKELPRDHWKWGDIYKRGGDVVELYFDRTEGIKYFE